MTIAAVASRWTRVKSALTPAEWRRAGAMAGFILALHAIGFFLLFVVIAPHHYAPGHDRRVRRRARRHRVHARHAPRLRRRPHRGDRQHDPQADGRRPAAAERRLLVLARPLVGRLRPGVPALARRQGARRAGAQRRLGAAPGAPAWSARASPGTLPLPDRRRSTSSILLGIVQGLPADAPRRRSTRRRSRSSSTTAGFMNRLLRPASRGRSRKPWQMYPVGLLFGLGFDTATEVALLVLAGRRRRAGLPLYAILVPADPVRRRHVACSTRIDGSFMNFAYGWAFSKPVRKVYYNITITGLSVAVALVIGTIELSRPDRPEAQPHGGPSGTGSQNFDINHARLHHRRSVRRHLGHRPRRLALRPDRGEVERRHGSRGGEKGRARGLTPDVRAAGDAQLSRGRRVSGVVSTTTKGL